jgi:hypothetical protein
MQLSTICKPTMYPTSLGLMPLISNNPYCRRRWAMAVARMTAVKNR